MRVYGYIQGNSARKPMKATRLVKPRRKVFNILRCALKGSYSCRCSGSTLDSRIHVRLRVRNVNINRILPNPVKAAKD